MATRKSTQVSPDYTAVEVSIVPGQMGSTLHPAGLEEGMGELATNCSTERGVFERDLRYRKFSIKGTNSVADGTLGAGVFYGSPNRMYLVNNGYVRSINIAGVESYDGSLNNWADGVTLTDLGPTEVTFQTSGDYVFWRHKNLLFAAGGTGATNDTTGNVVVITQAPTSNGKHSADYQYKQYDLYASGVVTVDPPPYKPREHGTDTYAGTGTTSVATESRYGDVWVKAHNTGDPTGYKNTPMAVAQTFSTANQDWSRYDYVYFELEVNDGNYWGDFQEGVVKTATSTDDWGFGVINAGVVTYAPCRYFLTGVGEQKRLGCWVDLEGVARTSRNAIDGVQVQAIVRRDGPDGFAYSKFYLGGVHMLSGRTGVDTDIEDVDLEDIGDYTEYAYAFDGRGTYGGTSGTGLSNATVVKIPSSLLLGDKKLSTLPRMGAHVNIAVTPVTSGGYAVTDVVRVFRKKKSDSLWYEVSATAGGGDTQGSFATGAPARQANNKSGTENVQVYDRLLESELGAGGQTATTLTIGTTIDPTLSGRVSGIVCGASWKGANVYGSSDGVLYMADPTSYKRVGWSQTDIGPLNGASDPRTVELPYGKESVQALVAQDALYAFTKTKAFAFVGDVPSRAAGPVSIRQSGGCVSKRGAVAFERGALYCAADGLYYVEVPPTYTGVAGDVQVVEVTKDVRPTYATVVGTTESTQDKAVLAVHKNHVWIFRDHYYLHRWPSGKWVYGSWATGSNVKVKAADTHPVYGIILAFDDGRVGVIGDYPTDGATNIAGSNGTSFTWSYKDRLMVADLRVLQAWVRTNEAASPAVSILVSSSDLTDQTLSFTANTDQFKAFKRGCGGRRAQATLSGGGEDIVYKAVLVCSRLSRRRGS